MDDIEHYATQIVLRLKEEGYIAYFAGGWVRDLLMKHPSSDIDIATSAPPNVILDLFPQTILVGLAFGVVIVLKGGHQFEVSTFRKDLHYEGGRRPVGIEYSDPREDAIRRDFTINGMFYDPLEKLLIDYVGGEVDIKRQLIRTIGDPQDRFFEDRLRMIRAVRFAARFEFAIDPDTQIAIAENADTLFPAVAMERIWQEFNKMATYPRFSQALIQLHRLGLLPVIFPQLRGVHLNEIERLADSLKHLAEKTPTILQLLEFFPNFQLEEQRELCRYLKLGGQEMKMVERVASIRNDLESPFEPQRWCHRYAHPQFNSELEVVLARLPKERKQEFRKFHQEKRALYSPHIEQIASKKTFVKSSTLQALGIFPGKEMGLLLKEAERIALMHYLVEEDQLLELLKNTALWRTIKENQKQ